MRTYAIGAHGGFNNWNLQQIQELTGNFKAKWH